MANKKPLKAGADPELVRARDEPEQLLGAYIAEVRNQKGLSHDDVVAQTRIPVHYLRMIEKDDYVLVADQLYLLPFIRRYADFLGLDGEEVAMRFVHEVQHAEISVQRISDPMTIRAKNPRRWRRIALVVLIVIALAAIVELALRFALPTLRL